MYKFDGVEEHPVLVRPHRNSEKQNPHIRTATSVKRRLTTALATQAPKEAIDAVTKDSGGLLHSVSASHIPKNRQQAYYLKRSQNIAGPGHSRDMLFVTMEQCKLAEKGNRYVQEVTCAPEPMAVLATEQQLADLERFCCNPAEFCVMGIDPTFDLGEFSVTPFVYQNLLIVNDRGLSPWVLGPILVHYRKEFHNYNFFLSALLGLRPLLSNVQAVGTDGKKNLIQAIHQQFQNALQLRCFRHLQSNLEHHLQEKKVPMSLIQLYVQDVFGSDSQEGIHFEGLVDCHSEDFRSKLTRLQPVWDQRDLSVSDEPHSHGWFTKFKIEGFIQGTLRETREKAGLGCPPKPYYTNSNEAMNRVLKEAVKWKKSQLPEFITKMKTVVDQQREEVEKAVISTGEYTLKPRFGGLRVDQSTFYRMNEKQRLHALKPFHQCTLEEASTIKATQSGKGKGRGKERAKSYFSHNTIVPTFSDSSILLSLPSDTLEGIWTKALELSNNSKAIVPMPGGGDKDCFVLSKSSTMPHAITVKGSLYHCDA